MKTKITTPQLFLAAIALLIAGSALPLQAYDHDKSGYFDEHHHHHPYVYHNHHRGYWDSSHGSRVFISI
jgi:hypothetical protein